MAMDPVGVTTRIVPIPCGRTDAKAVCVLIPAIPPGVMGQEMSIMMITLTNME